MRNVYGFYILIIQSQCVTQSVFSSALSCASCSLASVGARRGSGGARILGEYPLACTWYAARERRHPRPKELFVGKAGMTVGETLRGCGGARVPEGNARWRGILTLAGCGGARFPVGYLWQKVASLPYVPSVTAQLRLKAAQPEETSWIGHFSGDSR